MVSGKSADADHLSVDLDGQFPLSGAELIEWSSDGNHLPNAYQNVETDRLDRPDTRMGDTELKSRTAIIGCAAVYRHAGRPQEVSPAEIGAEIRPVLELFDYSPGADRMGHLKYGVFTERFLVAYVGGDSDRLVGVFGMPAGSVVVGGERQSADADHLTVDLDGQFPLSGAELIERCGNGNKLPNSNVNVDGFGNVIWVELLEVGDRLKGCVVVVETENLVVGKAAEGASVSAVLAQPHSVSESAAV